MKQLTGCKFVIKPTNYTPKILLAVNRITLLLSPIKAFPSPFSVSIRVIRGHKKTFNLPMQNTWHHSKPTSNK